MDNLNHWFHSGQFMPHGHCYSWTPGLVALHALSDALIALAYGAISVTLVYFIRERKDLKFKWMVLWFAVFILACGGTHFLELWNIWHADYWVSGSIKALTATASVSTAILLVNLIPKALALPSPDALQIAYDELDQRVRERTEELANTARDLEAEVNERKASEMKALRLAAIVKSSDDAIIGKTLKGIITSWNPGAEKIFGYTEEEVVGKPMVLLVPPERIDEEREILAKIALGKNVEHFETERVRKDGNRINISTTISPITDQTGEIIGASTIARDITDSKRTELALRESEERFRRAIVDAPFPILIHAEGGAILQTSNSWCEITGYSHDELATINDWVELAYGENREQVIAQIKTLYDLKCRVSEGDYPIRTKAGETRIWEFSSGPLGRLSDGRRMVISMAMDVTARRAAEVEVQKLNANLEQLVQIRTQKLQMTVEELEGFSYSVSHDLRTPLRAIDGYSLILQEEYSAHLDKDGQRLLGVIRSETARMGQLIDDLLTFSRLGRQSLDRQRIDMGTLAQTVFEELAALVPTRKIQLHLLPLPPAQGSPSMIRQVWVNLIGNAIKFTQRQEVAVIEINATDTEGDAPVYTIKDNGFGFDMRHAGKLFGVFQRLHSEKEFEGSGVGLALVHRIITRHGGRIWAQGEVNRGAKFRFTLPATKQ